MMEWSSLELKVISCRDLRAFNFFQKLSVYAVVSISNDELNKDAGQQQCLQRQKTMVDTEGGRHPEWNQVMRFDLKAISLADHLFVKFKLRCTGVIFGKRTISEVHVPFKDLIDGFNGTVRFVSYQARSSDGKPNGVLNFSYTVKGKAKNDSPSLSPSPSPSPRADQLPCVEKVNQPSMKADVPSRLYPSLDDIHSPLPGLGDNIQESHISPPLHLPAFVVGHGIYHHPCAAPHRYASETAGHGYSLRAGWAI